MLVGPMRVTCLVGTAAWLLACTSTLSESAPSLAAAPQPATSAFAPAGANSSTARPDVPDESKSYVAETAPPVESADAGLLRWPPPRLASPAGIAACARLRRPPEKRCQLANGMELEKLVELCGLGQEELLDSAGSRGSDAGALARAVELSLELASLEGCSVFPSGVVRLLRARLLPECAEELASPLLITSDSKVAADVLLELYAAAFSAMSARLPLRPMPRFRGDRFALDHFVREQVEPWARTTTRELERYRAAMERLPLGSGARLLALTGLAYAEQRFWQAFRSAPIPDSIKRDYVERSAYYSRIDAAATPAHERFLRAAREQALGLGIHGGYGEADLLRLSLLAFGAQGRLQHVALPEPPEFGLAESRPARLAAVLPSRISLWLLTPEQRREPTVLSALVRRGLPAALRAEISERLEKGDGDPMTRARLHELLAHGLVRLGLITREARLFARAVVELEQAKRLGVDTSATRLLHALSNTFARSTSGEFVLVDSPVPALDTREFNAPNSDPLFAFDRAVLVLASTPFQAKRPELDALRGLVESGAIAEKYRRCVREELGLCGYGIFRREQGQSCVCTNWPWRVTSLR